MNLAEEACFSMVGCFDSETEKGGHVYQAICVGSIDAEMHVCLWVAFDSDSGSDNLRELGSRIRGRWFQR